jgi:hypothetical protein
LLKIAEGQRGWYMMAYVWNEDQTDAVAAPEGQANALGTQHDVPAQSVCRNCHGNVPDILLGVSAIQLDHDGAGATLRSLDGNGWLSNTPPAQSLTLPGSNGTADALGYPHANCGTCHNPHSTAFERVNLDLRLLVDKLGTPDETPTYLSTIDVPAADPVSDTTLRLAPSEPGKSQLYVRMNQRATDYAMPPLASEDVDAAGLELVKRWIESVPSE